MNIFERIIYFFLSIKKKTLEDRLDRHFKSNPARGGTKTVITANETMTLSAETQKHAQLVHKNIEEILQANENDPYKLVQYIESQGTKVIKLKNADKMLNAICEDEGLILEQRGLAALYINIITGNGFSFRNAPIFIMREGEINPFYMIHQFYKWYSLKSKLPGFDYKSQQLFKIYLRTSEAGMTNLSLEQLTGLKEAIARDREATDYAYNAAVAHEGGKKAFDKLSDGEGANI